MPGSQVSVCAGKIPPARAHLQVTPPQLRARNSRPHSPLASVRNLRRSGPNRLPRRQQRPTLPPARRQSGGDRSMSAQATRLAAGGSPARRSKKEWTMARPQRQRGSAGESSRVQRTRGQSARSPLLEPRLQGRQGGPRARAYPRPRRLRRVAPRPLLRPRPRRRNRRRAEPRRARPTSCSTSSIAAVTLPDPRAEQRRPRRTRRGS